MMSLERSRMEWSGVVLLIVIAAAVTGIVLSNLTLGRASGAKLERPGLQDERRAPTLAERLATIDAAIARRDPSKAIFAWRDAYGLALGARRWEAMVEVGDAASRIDAMAGHPVGYPTGFRAEARRAYLRALFLARDVRSRDGIERVGQAFAALGDAETATLARAMTVTR
jgi:hypothetical protein